MHATRTSWIEQCDAAQTIKARFGLTAAFDYLVGEKLMNFAIAASRHLDFARELPRFVSEVRHMFTPDEISAHLAQIERSQNEMDVDALQEDALGLGASGIPSFSVHATCLSFLAGLEVAAERVQQFMLVKELLTATMLGTS